ncbi:MAG: hypothetical protein IKN72_03715 [Clostridia bacterium]|nr:hypothetical protein [Clostridia bacterium]
MVNDATYVAAIRSLWCDRCMVTVKQNIQDGAFTRQQNAVLFSDEPCRLSFRSVEVTNESDHAARTVQATVLILDRGREIPPGAEIAVTHEGVLQHYERSGVAAVYSVHQEVPLQLKGAWA